MESQVILIDDYFGNRCKASPIETQKTSIEETMKIRPEDDPVFRVVRTAVRSWHEVSRVKNLCNFTTAYRAAQTVALSYLAAKFLLLGARLAHRPTTYLFLFVRRTGRA